MFIDFYWPVHLNYLCVSFENLANTGAVKLILLSSRLLVRKINIIIAKARLQFETFSKRPIKKISIDSAKQERFLSFGGFEVTKLISCGLTVFTYKKNH